MVDVEDAADDNIVYVNKIKKVQNNTQESLEWGKNKLLKLVTPKKIFPINTKNQLSYIHEGKKQKHTSIEGKCGDSLLDNINMSLKIGVICA